MSSHKFSVITYITKVEKNVSLKKNLYKRRELYYFENNLTKALLSFNRFA